MIPRTRLAALAALLALALAPPLAVPAPIGAQQSPPPGPAALPSIAEKTRGLAKMDGFIPLYWDERAGKLWMEIPRTEQEMIYVVSLPAGVGSNDIGLDRGQLGGERIVRFSRVGPRVLMVQPNLGFRAGSSDPDERRTVEESFAQSVLWGFTVAAESGGRVLVDATDFALRDAHGVARALRGSGQGDFRLDATRSALFLPRTKVFPRNTEIEVTLTFAGDNPGRYVRDVTPTPEAVTVRERHSFVALPEPGYVPRALDPRSGFFGMQYADYSAPLGESIQKRFINRHRLQKKDPGAALSDPVEPIVYYVDRGAPEPIRTALLEGARWWNQAFEAAGYRDAFRVELLPEGADPMDVRYNVIQWVHRATRGWSYGGSVSDPRTGEIIKGHVTLGSLRVRQDYLIAEGLLSPYRTGDETPPELSRMALARIRQLSAHEVGHTLGLAHNYVASAQGPEGRASVMDYPHPLVRLAADGSVDLSAAYAEGIGAWDKVSVTWGYGDGQAAALDRVLADARARGLTFLTDQDARPAGSAHPRTHMWDNGTDAVTELGRVMRVRRAALDRFGETAIRRGMPMATLEEALVPLYLHHRYQAEAAAKVLGGVEYTYALRGDGQEPLRPVSAAEQERAMSALLATLDPAALALPRPLLAKIPPRPAGWEPHRELFPRWTGLTFDAVSPATSAAGLTVGLMLNPERAARLVEQHALDPALPGLEWVLDRLERAAFAPPSSDPYHAEIQRAVRVVVVRRMMALADETEMPQVKAVMIARLSGLRSLGARSAANAADGAVNVLIAQEVASWMDRPYQERERPRPVSIPPGAPIGDEDEGWEVPGLP